MFIELSDEIPYTKINKISLRSVDYLNGTFVINLDRKCENLPEEKNYVINRKMSDLKWVKQKLGVQSPWIVTIPSLAQSSWSFSDVISTSDQQKSRLKLWYNEQYMRKTTERFLHILIDVVLPNIYKNTGFIRTSLFTFFDKNYDIYKTEAYQQSTKKEAQLDISNESTLSMWANSLGKGSMKLLEMLNVWNQQQNHKYLTNCIKEVIELKEGANQLYNELDSIQRSLETLQGNFLNEQKLLKQKEGRVFDYQLKLQDLLRVSTQVLEEMKKVEKKCKQLESKNEDKSYLKQQLGLYEKYILNEVGGLKGQWRKILADLYELNYQRQVQMKLGNVYSSKL